MKSHYLEILKEHGLVAIPEADETALAFYHEIHNTIFDENTPFNIKESSIAKDPNDESAMITCHLQLQMGVSGHEGVSYLMSKWYQYLSYSSAVFESVQRRDSDDEIKIEIFTLSKESGCSFLFVINDL